MPSFGRCPFLFTLALLLAAACVVHAAETPRTRVAGVAQAIEDRYFDADRGREIADSLREAADNGAFDALATPQALSDALTARLKPLDRHFDVALDVALGLARGAAPHD